MSKWNIIPGINLRTDVSNTGRECKITCPVNRGDTCMSPVLPAATADIRPSLADMSCKVIANSKLNTGTTRLQPDIDQLPPDAAQFLPDAPHLRSNRIQLQPDAIHLPPDAAMLSFDTIQLSGDAGILKAGAFQLSSAGNIPGFAFSSGHIHRTIPARRNIIWLKTRNYSASNTTGEQPVLINHHSHFYGGLYE